MTLQPSPEVAPSNMALAAFDVPPWYNTMVSITGLKENTSPGQSNPQIVAMAAYVGQVFPEQAKYAATYTSDDIAWCGLAAAYCMATCDISGPFGPTETDKWMWAQSWANSPLYVKLSQPVKGCIVVMTRSGGGHVTLYEEDAGSNIRCRGGNQSDMVNVSSYAKSSVIGYYWPKEVPPPPVPPRTLKKGDKGADVAEVQRILGLPADGDFGSITDSGVKQFQGACGLSKDGVVGSVTWAALYDLDDKMAAGSDGISDELSQQIDELCRNSPLNNYNWPGRGRGPSGYYAGMAKCFAWALQRPEEASVTAMAMAVTSNQYDALNVYRQRLEAEELDVSKSGIDTLRALFVMMVGLGMRESSGNHWCGRDMSASNTQADTAEAGSHQTSWNIRSASPAIPPLLPRFWADPNGFRPTWDRGVSPTASNLDAYGSGDGARYQFLAKYTPNFHILVTGVGMRYRSNHWGPINRGEVTINGQVDDLLLEVQSLVDAIEPEPPEPVPPEPEPEPEPEPGDTPEVTINVETKGDVIVHVVQTPPPESHRKKAARATSKSAVKGQRPTRRPRK